MASRQTASVRKPLPRADRRAWWVLLAALILTVLEGAVRKWAIGSETGLKSYLAYFSKDIVFGVLLLLPRPKAEGGATREFGKWLVPGWSLVLAGAVISSFMGRTNPVGALLTFRALVFLPVVAWLALGRVSGLPLRYSAGLMGALTIVNLALSIIQNQLPTDHILNRYVVTDADVVEYESRVRATGTFSYITGLSLMSSVGVWAGLVLVSAAKSKPLRAFGAASLVAGFGCALASISRAPVAVAGAMVLGWLSLSRSALSRLWRSAGILAVVTCLLLVCGVGAKLQILWDGLAARNGAAGDSAVERAFGQFGELWQALHDAPFGRGFGTEQIGGNYAATGALTFSNYETQFPRIMMESGILGFAGFLVICAGALVVLQRARSTARNSGQKDALLATQLLLASFFYTNVVFNHTASAFAWMLFAAVLAGTAFPADVSTSSHRDSRTKTGPRFGRSRPLAGAKGRIQ